MKIVYTIIQTIASIYTAFVSFTLLIQYEGKYELEWVTDSINFAKNWWLLSIIALCLAFAALRSYIRWEDENCYKQY